MFSLSLSCECVNNMRERCGRDPNDLVGGSVVEKEHVAADDGTAGEDDVRHLALSFVLLQGFEDGVGGASEEGSAVGAKERHTKAVYRVPRDAVINHQPVVADPD